MDILKRSKSVLNGNFYEYKLLLMDDTQRTRLEG